ALPHEPPGIAPPISTNVAWYVCVEAVAGVARTSITASDATLANPIAKCLTLNISPPFHAVIARPRLVRRAARAHAAAPSLRDVLASVLSDSALTPVEVNPGEVAGRLIAADNAVAEIEEEQAVVAVSRDGVAENSRAAERPDRDPRVPVPARVVSRDPDEVGAVVGIHPPSVVIQAVSDHGAPGRREDGDALARVPADPVSFDPRAGGVVDVDSADLEGGNVVGDDAVGDGRSPAFEELDSRADVVIPAPGADPPHG